MLHNAVKKQGVLSTPLSVDTRSSLGTSHLQSMTWEKVVGSGWQTRSKGGAGSKTAVS